MSTSRSVRAARQRGHSPPATPGASTQPEGQPPATTNVGVDRGEIVAAGLRTASQWSLRFILIVVALAILLWLLGRVWVGVLPVILSLIVATVLWPPTSWLTRRGAPPALAAAMTLLGALLLFLGILASIAPSIINQSREIADRAIEGVDEVRTFLSGPPVNLDNEQLDTAIDEGTAWFQDRSSEIASGVFTGVSAVGSGLVTLALVLVLTFFFIKDGPKFLPWLRRAAGRNAGQHLTEVLTRMWRTLGGFIRAQAMVSAFDAVFIGLGLLILGVPLALALAVITFFAGFVPIVGAITAGALAVLVALVTNGWQVALIVLGIVLLVQQVESNVLQPLLQGKTMQMHAGIILLSVAAGGTLFGIVGAFLAVPVAATLVVMLRYISEQIDLRTGDQHAVDLPVATPEGAVVAAEGERSAAQFRSRVLLRGRAAAEERSEAGRQPDRLGRLGRRRRGGGR